MRHFQVSLACAIVILACFCTTRSCSDRSSPLRRAADANSKDLDPGDVTRRWSVSQDELASIDRNGQPLARRLAPGQDELDPFALSVRGQLRQRNTNVPIPDFTIELNSAGGKDTVITGKDGRFTTSVAFETCHIGLLLIDHPARGASSFADQPIRLEHQHVAVRGESVPEALFETDIGPTYRINVTLPAGMQEDDFFATFSAPSPGWTRGIFETIAEDPNSQRALFYGAAMNPMEFEVKASLRSGAQRWVRFRAPIVDLSGDHADAELRALHLRSYDGLWAGFALINSVSGEYPETLSIELCGRGTINGRVLSDLDGTPVTGAWIRMSSANNEPHPVAEVGADMNGFFSFQWVPVGNYRLIVQSGRYRDWETAFSLGIGETKKVEARAVSTFQSGTISGAMRSRTGRNHAGGATITLRGIEDPNFQLSKTAVYKKTEGQFVAQFSFEKLPRGLYRLKLEPRDNRCWSPAMKTVAVPRDAVDFICEDEAATFDLAFQSIDAETNVELGNSWIIVWHGRGEEERRLIRDLESGHYLGVSEGDPLHWMVRAEGYRLAWGEATRFEENGPLRIVRVRLVSGWGQVFKITTPEREPIQGVEVLVNGARASVSDSGGRAILDLDKKPERLEFIRAGLRVSWGSVEPAEDGFGWGPETPVYMSPAH